MYTNCKQPPTQQQQPRLESHHQAVKVARRPLGCARELQRRQVQWNIREHVVDVVDAVEVEAAAAAVAAVVVYELERRYVLLC